MVGLTVPDINQSPSMFRQLVKRDSVIVPVPHVVHFYPIAKSRQDFRRYKEYLG